MLAGDELGGVERREVLRSGRFSGEENVGAIPKHGEVHSRSRCQAGRV